MTCTDVPIPPKIFDHRIEKALYSTYVYQDQVIRAAAEWARDNMGLEFERLRKDGVIYKILGKLF